MLQKWTGARLALAAKDTWSRLTGSPDDPASRLQRRVIGVLRRRPFCQYVMERRQRRRSRAISITLATLAGIVGALGFAFALLLGGIGFEGLGTFTTWGAGFVWLLSGLAALRAWSHGRQLRRLQQAPGWRVVELADEIDTYLVEHAPSVREAGPSQRAQLVAELTGLVEGLEQVADEAAVDEEAGLGGQVRTQRERLGRRIDDALAEQRARREIRGDVER